MRRIFFSGERKVARAGGVSATGGERGSERTGNRTDVGTDGRKCDRRRSVTAPNGKGVVVCESFISFRREKIDRICETGAREPRKETTIPPLPGSQASHGSKEDRSSQHILQVLIY